MHSIYSIHILSLSLSLSNYSSINSLSISGHSNSESRIHNPEFPWLRHFHIHNATPSVIIASFLFPAPLVPHWL